MIDPVSKKIDKSDGGRRLDSTCSLYTHLYVHMYLHTQMQTYMHRTTHIQNSNILKSTSLVAELLL